MTIFLFPSAKHDSNASPNSDSEDGHHHNNKKECAIEYLKARLNSASAVACGYLQAFVSKTQDFAKVCFFRTSESRCLGQLVAAFFSGMLFM